MLAVRDLATAHGRIRVLHNVSFHVNRGELLAIIGANGAGKSTLLGTLAGIYRPSEGKVVFKGQDITGLPAERTVRCGLCLVPERRQIFDELTVRDNLLLGAYCHYRRTGNAVMDEFKRVLEIFPLLAGMQQRLGGTLSGGEQQMLAIGRGLMARPEILLLDEPSLGLAPMIIQEILRVLQGLKAQGTTILLVEQNARAALKVADRVCVLERGRIALQGKAAELLEDPRIQSAYMGKGYHVVNAV